jgi:hypothetical protein
MVEPIKHNMMSAVSTAGVETAKGAAEGILALPVIGAVLGAGILGGGALLASAAFTVGAPVILGLAAFGAVAGGVVGAVPLAFPPVTATLAAVGGLLGMAKGGTRISKETEAANDLIEKHNQKRLSMEAMAANQGLQQGYMVGFQEGRNQVVNALKQQMEAQAAQVAEAEKANNATKETVNSAISPEKFKKPEGQTFAQAAIDSKKPTENGVPTRG